MKARLVWPALLAVGTVAEVRSLVLHDGCTLSETYRAFAHTHTPAGKAITVIGGLALFGWLIPHLCKSAAEVADAIVTAIEEATP